MAKSERLPFCRYFCFSGFENLTADQVVKI
jgi:hypothetical protein